MKRLKKGHLVKNDALLRWLVLIFQYPSTPESTPQFTSTLIYKQRS